LQRLLHVPLPLSFQNKVDQNGAKSVLVRPEGENDKIVQLLSPLQRLDVFFFAPTNPLVPYLCDQYKIARINGLRKSPAIVEENKRYMDELTKLGTLRIA
jgi:hypothetical protein